MNLTTRICTPLLLMLSASVAHAETQAIQTAEVAFERLDYQTMVESLHPTWERGALTDSRGLFLLSISCRRVPHCRSKTGQITRAAADAGYVQAMLNLASSVVPKYDWERFPDLELDRATAYRYALAGRELSPPGPQREAAERILNQVGRKLSAAERAALTPQPVANPPVQAVAASGTSASALASSRSSMVKAGNEGPFGLRFGMSAAEVTLEEVDSDRYGDVGIFETGLGASQFHSCRNGMWFVPNGNYAWQGLKPAATAAQHAMLERWFTALGQHGSDVAAIASDLNHMVRGGIPRSQYDAIRRRYRITDDAALDEKLAGITVKFHVTDSGTRLCLGFFQDRLFRVTANLSAKRDLISALIAKLRQDYAGALYQQVEVMPRSTRRWQMHRWAGDPGGVWATVQFEEYVPLRNVDMSKAYSFGARPTGAPAPATMVAEAQFYHAPLFAEVLGEYRRRVLGYAQEQSQQRQERRERALEEF